MTNDRSTPSCPDQLALALTAARDATGRVDEVERLQRRIELRLSAAVPHVTAANALQPKPVWLVGKNWIWIAAAAVGVASVVFMASPRPTPARSVALPPPQLVAARAPDSAHSVEQQSVATSIPDPGPKIAEVETRIASVQQLVNPPHASARAPRAARRAQGKAPEASQALASVASDPEAEVALVARAQALVLPQPTAALALLAEHEARFPRGVLAQERDTLRIDAERALGQSAQAREHARAFVAKYPDSPQARSLSLWIATQENSASDHNPARTRVLTP